LRERDRVERWGGRKEGSEKQEGKKALTFARTETFDFLDPCGKEKKRKRASSKISSSHLRSKKKRDSRRVL